MRCACAQVLHPTNDSGPSMLLGPLGCYAALNRKDAPARRYSNELRSGKGRRIRETGCDGAGMFELVVLCVVGRMWLRWFRECWSVGASDVTNNTMPIAFVE